MAYNAAYATNPTTATTTVEKSVLAVPAVAYSPTGNYQGVALTGAMNITNGTALTAIVTVRNGSGTAGTVIATPMTVTTISGALSTIPFAVIDTTNPPASQYNVTFTNGQSATTIVNNAFIWVDPVVL